MEAGPLGSGPQATRSAPAQNPFLNSSASPIRSFGRFGRSVCRQAEIPGAASLMNGRGLLPLAASRVCFAGFLLRAHAACASKYLNDAREYGGLLER